MKVINSCRGCHCSDITDFFDLGQQPFANALIKPEQLPEEKYYPLSLSWCSNCNLIQLNQTADPKELFSNYVWVTGTSSTARKYAQAFSSLVLKQSTKASNFVLEIASNDGTFLKAFQKKNCQVLGVDPAQNIAEMANQDNVPTLCHFFGESVAQKILDEHSYPDFIVVRNVLPHVANLHDFVKGLALCLNEKNTLVIEFHYAKIILDELHYDSIYHEHLCYFSIKSISHLLKLYNLSIQGIKESPISGGSLVLFIQKDKETSEQTQKYLDIETQNKVNQLKSWQYFAEQAQQHREQFLNLIQEEKAQGHSMIGYGASARSSTFLNFCQITHKDLMAIADQSPIKHHLLAPGTGIPILAPEKAMEKEPNTIVILAWNFFDEIAEILKSKFNFKGHLIKPFPFPAKRI